MRNEIHINCTGSSSVDINELVDVQGEVKFLPSENLQKLLNTMSENGFCEPFVIWRDEEQKPIVIGGNQRLKALLKAQELSWTLPEKFPAVEVKADNLKQAKKILLSLASTFGKVDKHQLENFVFDNDMKLEELKDFVNFPELGPDFKLPNIETERTAGVQTNVTEGESEEGSVRVMKIPFLSEDFDKALSLLNKVYDKMKTRDMASSHGEVFMLLLQLWDKDNSEP